ncbi:hypothetical protein [Aquabacterium sp.]|uniref:hypothetical protein n=1 Tax=Aquabacterium sp. TaxID=1872578 RepID=UPI0035ADC984
MAHVYKPTFRRRVVNFVTSDAAVAALIAASVLSVTSVVGLYASSSQERAHRDTGADAFSGRPPPVWMPLKPVRAQMSDGNMLAVKVSLQLSKTKSSDELSDYAGVFGSLVERAGQHTSRRDLRAEDGIERFGIQIQRDLNDYLDEHDATPSRVTSVLFDELVQLPN